MNPRILSKVTPPFLLALLAALLSAFPAGDPDVYFHLAVGRETLDSGSILDTETLTLISEGKPFYNHEWLFDVILWSAHEAFGPEGVTLIQMAVSACLFLLVAMLALRLGAAPWPTFLLAAVFMPLFRAHLEARPHIFGYALAAATTLFLLHLKEGRKKALLPLTLVSLAWTNTHGSFPLGVAIWLALLAQSPRPPTLLLSGPLIMAATLLNPWGPRLWAVVFHHAEPAYRRLVPEWQSMPFGENPVADLLFFALVAASLLSFLPRQNRSRFGLLSLLVVFLAPAAYSYKFTLGLAVGALPVLASNLSKWPRLQSKKTQLLLAPLSLASLLLATPKLPPWSAAGLGLNHSGHPRLGLAVLRESTLSGPVFAPFHEGGYVAYMAHPTLRPLIDGRAYVHGLQGIRTYLGALADYRAFKALCNQYAFIAVIADIQDPSFPRLLAGLSSDNSFELIHLDDQYAVFIPVSARPANLLPFKVIKASTDPRYLADIPVATLPLAFSEAERILLHPEGQTLGRLVRSILNLKKATVSLDPRNLDPCLDPIACREAAEDLAQLVQQRPDVPMFRFFYAKTLASLGLCGQAKAEAAAARKHLHDAAILLNTLSACSD